MTRVIVPFCTNSFDTTFPRVLQEYQIVEQDYQDTLQACAILLHAGIANMQFCLFAQFVLFATAIIVTSVLSKFIPLFAAIALLLLVAATFGASHVHEIIMKKYQHVQQQVMLYLQHANGHIFNHRGVQLTFFCNQTSAYTNMYITISFIGRHVDSVSIMDVVQQQHV